MKRDVDDILLQWKDETGRLPLLVRGARQVGKSFTISGFGERHFDNCVVVNFEERPEVRRVFFFTYPGWDNPEHLDTSRAGCRSRQDSSFPGWDSGMPPGDTLFKVFLWAASGTSSHRGGFPAGIRASAGRFSDAGRTYPVSIYETALIRWIYRCFRRRKVPRT